MAPPVISTVTLDTPADWEPWLYVIKIMSTSVIDERDAWEYINPRLPTEPKLPQRPDKPSVSEFNKQRIIELDTDRRGLYELMLQEYCEELSQVNKTLETISRVRSYIVSSVSVKNIVYIEGATTVYQMLVALQKRLAPTDKTKKIQLKNRYNKLKKFRKNGSIEQWLETWERTYTEAKALRLLDVANERPLFDFIQAISSIDPGFASVQEYSVSEKLSEGKAIDLYDLIENFRNHHRRMEALKSSI
jgi:hypothetical protein